MEPKRDELLLAEHVAGDPAAFSLLVRRYADEVFHFVSRFVSNAAVADDLVQETFLQVHTSAASFDSTRSFKPWLYTIAANKSRDFLRSRGRRQELSLDTPGLNEDGPSPAAGLADDGASVTDGAMSAELGARVRAVVDRMPEQFRLVLLLGYYQQLPYSEIAEVLDIPVGTVKSRLHAAVNQFARMWAAASPDEDAPLRSRS